MASPTTEHMMKLGTAQAIVDAANEVGVEMAVREDYVGRGSFKPTAAITYNTDQDLLQAVALAAVNVKQAEQDGSMTLETFLEDIGIVRIDNMGRSLIIY
jgi:hypothetical protein